MALRTHQKENIKQNIHCNNVYASRNKEIDLKSIRRSE